jgi:DNA-binding response OmpR family regulator
VSDGAVFPGGGSGDPARPRAAAAEGREPVVLVVDDSDPKRYVATRWLRRAGFAVVEARTGHEALQLAPRCDLVVLDVRLPDVSGFEVCRRLRIDPATAQVPVLHLSAHATTAHERASGLDGGADGYLTQPVDEEELIATVRALLRIRRVEGALRVSEERYRLAARPTTKVAKRRSVSSESSAPASRLPASASSARASSERRRSVTSSIEPIMRTGCPRSSCAT